MDPRVNLKALSFAELDEFVRALGWPRYRSRQISDWLYQKGARSIDAMSNLSKADRVELSARATIGTATIATRQRSIDGTAKILFTLEDGQKVETVLIPDRGGSAGGDETDPEPPERGPLPNAAPGCERSPVTDDRLTLCLSSQVGCTLDCGFCLTGTMGLVRNLRAHEIVEQVLGARATIDRPVTNIVFMGMGEPLANYREVVEAIRRLIDRRGLGFSPRRITVSTSGLVPQIERLAAEGLGVNLAISLNATTDAVRDRIMPLANRAYPLARLLAACRAFPLAPRRRLFIEYVLLAGVNDSVEDAHRLVRLLRGMRCKINLIPFNAYPGSPFVRPADDQIERFQAALVDAGLFAFIRKSRGRDILAACGQLRTEFVVLSAP